MTFILLSLFLSMFSYASAEELHIQEYGVALTPDHYDIYATVCIPEGEGPFPAVVMLHGTGSNRNETGDAYLYTTHTLAEKFGIASIRFDFPGNGESTEDYKEYTFHTAVADAKTAAEYMESLDSIDGDMIGIMGWGQGGTDVLLACAWEPDTFKSLVTWAAVPELKMDGFFTDADYEEAKNNGFFVMEFDWRDGLNVSLDWCEDVMTTDVLEEFEKNYVGPVLAIHGKDDTTVDPEWSKKIVEKSKNVESSILLIDGMDHTFNVLSEDLSALYQSVDATGEYLSKTLK